MNNTAQRQMTAEEQQAAREAQEHYEDLMHSVATAAMQGLIIRGMEPDVAGVAAWTSGVPGYFEGVRQYQEQQAAIDRMYAKQASMQQPQQPRQK